MIKKLIALGLICLLAGLAFSADLYKVKTFPETRGDRFFASGTGTVTATNSDTILSAGTPRSLAFTTTTSNAGWFGGDYGEASVVPASELYLCGSVGPPVTAANMDDSLIVSYWIISTADGDSGVFWGADTVAIDTTGMNITTGEYMFFLEKLTPTDKEGNAYIPHKMKLSFSVISTDGGDTLLLDDCQVLMRWTN